MGRGWTFRPQRRRAGSKADMVDFRVPGRHGMKNDSPALARRPTGPISRVVGLYQTLLRRSLEHFFPDAILDAGGDRSFINWDGAHDEEHYRMLEDPDGLGVQIEWFRTRYLFQPASPSPFLPAERRLIATILKGLDLRFRGLFDLGDEHRSERFPPVLEDVIVPESLDWPTPFRAPPALEALRVAALSPYETRRVSLGALLLGTPHNPAEPGWVNP